MRFSKQLISIFESAETVNTNNGSANGLNYHCTFNPIDKWVEAMEKNEKLYEELLKSEREKVALMEKLLDQLKTT